MASTKVTLTREELYELVWSRPVVKLAPEYGLSNVGFSKMCARLDVPTPGRGYWARVAIGEKEDRPDPPKAGKRMARHVTLSVVSEMELATKREKPVAPIVVVRDTLVGARPEVLALKRRLDQQGPHRIDGMKWLRGPWSMATVRVSASAQARLLRILDALLRGVVQRGNAIQFEEPKGPRDDTRLAALCRGQVIGISLAERATQSSHVLWRRRRGTPRGSIFRLRGSTTTRGREG
jgi:hypothetical protein